MRNPLDRKMIGLIAAGVAAATLIAACGTTDPATAGTADSSASTSAVVSAGLFDSSTVHSLSIQYDETAYQSMIDTFVASGDKEWISATVTIDGTVFSNVGIKLKGNSTLQGLRSTGTDGVAAAGAGGMQGGGPGGDVSADAPEGLPWRIRLDKFVDGQSYQGAVDFVVRGGNTETGLNEAVALELIGVAGMATEQATPARFSVNGSVETLRLVVENPDDEWDDTNFDSAGILYKAEAAGDYSYRGDDAAAYADIFSVEASTSGDDDYTPLIAFLKWVNESDDATFAAELGSHLDVPAFAKYLAIQDLVANTDDIDGPGNNSYLRYDAGTGVFTVVAWDQNLSFGGMGGGMGGGGGQAGGGRMQPPNGGAVPSAGTVPSAGAVPNDGAMPTGARPGGPAGRGGNILAERFKANADFNAMYKQAVTDLRAELYASGDAQQILDSWTAVLSTQATDLVSQATITSEAASISKYFTAS